MRQSKLNQAPRCESWVGCIFWKGKQPSRGWVRGSLLHGVPEPWNLFPSQNFCILLKVRFQPLGYSTPHAADFSARRGWIFAFPVQKVEKPRPPPVGRLGGRWHLTSTTLTKVIWSLQPHAADSRTRRGWAQNQARLYLKPDAADFSWYETSKNVWAQLCARLDGRWHSFKPSRCYLPSATQLEIRRCSNANLMWAGWFSALHFF